MSTPIRVVVADDSPFVCRLLTSHLHSSPDMEVVGTALNGVRAVELVKNLRPDAVTLDLDMPEMDGLEALGRIMHDCPTPVIMVSGVSRQAAQITLRALNMGAVDFILKYTPGVDTNPEALRQEIIAKVKAASQIKVIRSVRPYSALGQSAVRERTSAEFDRIQAEAEIPAKATIRPKVVEDTRKESRIDDLLLQRLPGGVIVIGASTGGPLALRELLSGLPADFPAAIIVVQHMPPNFTGVLAAQLDRQVKLRVKEAEEGDRLQPGLVLVAPGGYHLLLRPDARVELNQGQEIGGHRPSIDVTMQSVAQVYGSRTKGVILTGMGNDGTMGLVSIHSKGGKTFAQDEASCVVNGMPQRAIEQGVIDHIAPPSQIAQILALQIAWTREKKI